MNTEQRDSEIAAHYETLLADNPILDAERVNQIFLDCLPREDEIVVDEKGERTVKNLDDVTMVPGIMATYGLNKTRLESHRNEISVMVDQVDERYFVGSNSGGWTFLNLCNDKFGRQWTGLHRTMEEFCVLAMATGYAVFVAPRIAWRIFEGGMPYLAFRHEPLDEAGIQSWNEKLKLVSEDFEAAQAGDNDRAVKGIQALTAMMAGLR